MDENIQLGKEITKEDFITLFNKRIEEIDLSYPETPEKDIKLNEQLQKLRNAALLIKIDEQAIVEIGNRRAKKRSAKENKDFNEKSKHFPTQKVISNVERRTKLQKAQDKVMEQMQKLGLNPSQIQAVQSSLNRQIRREVAEVMPMEDDGFSVTEIPNPEKK